MLNYETIINGASSALNIVSRALGYRVPLAKSLALVAGSCVVYKIIVHRRTLVAFLVIGPYATVVQHRLPMALQRAIIEYTREDREISLFPQNSIVSAEHARKADNGHPISGGTRDVARETISLAIRAAGFRHYEISPARQSPAEAASHQHYAAADLVRAATEDKIQDGDVVVAIDIDYYLRDIDRYLGRGVPFMAYTFNPVEVAGRDGDSFFRITNNQVTFDVSGGGSWSHEVWDWCAFGEFIETRDASWLAWFARAVGLTKSQIHKVHYCRPWPQSPHRALVWCLPVASYWRFTFIPTDLHTRTLRRVRYQDTSRPGWNSIVSTGSEGLNISLGREGADHCVTIPKVHYDMLMGLSSAQSLSSRMIGLKYTDPSVLATVAQYYQGKNVEVADADRIGRAINPKVHWPAHVEVDEAEVSARVYASPLVSDENMMPMIKRWETLSLSLDRRVTFQRNPKVPGKRLRAYAIEFVDLVVPERGVGVPYSLEDTAAMLDKPSQTLAIQQVWETVDMPPRRLIEAFVKNEPTMKAGRIISSFADMRFLLRFSSYTLAFRDQVLHAEHNRHWFCPGLTPEQIATKVVDYVSGVEEPSEGDFSNFDGTVSEWLQRHVMNAVYLRYFNHRAQRDLRSYTDMLVSCPARAKRFGFAYDAGVGVKSGSPTTCDLNTVCNGFLQYCSIRMTHPELTPIDAFRLIGLAFGDDSLFERRFAKNYAKVSAEVGMVLKIERFDPAQGITFLARVYPDPYTSTTSFQDPLRTWRKLHLTTRDPTIPLATAAIDRVEGYLVTDGLSPLTGAYCRMVKRVYEAGGAEDAAKRRSRKSHSREKPYWLTVGGAWPQDVKDVDLMFQCAAARTGVDLETLRSLDQRLGEITDVWADITINRDNEPNPYKDTLDLEGPADGRVDDRVFQNDKHVMRLRANQVTSSQAGAAGSGDASNDPNAHDRGSQRQQGSASVLRVPDRAAPAGVSSDEQPAHQTASRSSASRGGAGPGRGGRRRPGPPAKTTAGGARDGNQARAPTSGPSKRQAEGRSRSSRGPAGSRGRGK
ncbi:RNA dependent RNA polymerase protein A [Nodamura virus]|uniref:RNA-directed RNA polymerase n=2 Tax=Nodamura virus (strain Mag115) TaxID=914672 RepID=RDRP_NODAM|nr:RNA dependent RNA polymerase protein A [Nodamura virus]Q9IMM4.1 RecName: Full=RNA-directed RNA polymerase; Short=RdRp; AltName: Full=RNA replicase; Short=Protein A [Nodamura virus Mag115]AAF97860.1 RNA dependent RNA polymerase protein A [Nodamura virus]